MMKLGLVFLLGCMFVVAHSAPRKGGPPEKHAAPIVKPVVNEDAIMIEPARVSVRNVEDTMQQALSTLADELALAQQVAEMVSGTALMVAPGGTQDQSRAMLLAALAVLEQEAKQQSRKKRSVEQANEKRGFTVSTDSLKNLFDLFDAVQTNEENALTIEEFKNFIDAQGDTAEDRMKQKYDEQANEKRDIFDLSGYLPTQEQMEEIMKMQAEWDTQVQAAEEKEEQAEVMAWLPMALTLTTAVGQTANLSRKKRFVSLEDLIKSMYTDQNLATVDSSYEYTAPGDDTSIANKINQQVGSSTDISPDISQPTAELATRDVEETATDIYYAGKQVAKPLVNALDDFFFGK